MTLPKALLRACRRRKEKLTCAEVQKALAAETGGHGSYDALTALRFLPCNSQCKQAEVSRPLCPHPTSLLKIHIVRCCLQSWVPRTQSVRVTAVMCRARSLLLRR